MNRLSWLSRLILVGFALSSSSTLTAPHAVALTVAVKCEPPSPGVYTLGWGYSHLIIPPNGKPYGSFRGKKTPINDTICKSGDGRGAVVFGADGTVWAYVKAQK